MKHRTWLVIAFALGVLLPHEIPVPTWRLLVLPQLLTRPIEAAVASPRMYSLSVATHIYDPLDSTLYYWGGANFNPQASEGRQKIILSHNGRIVAGTVLETNLFLSASNESTSLILRKNATTDTTVHATFKHDATATFTLSGFPISFVTGDGFEFKLTTPAFATNPQQSIYVANLLFEADSR